MPTRRRSHTAHVRLATRTASRRASELLLLALAAAVVVSMLVLRPQPVAAQDAAGERCRCAAPMLPTRWSLFLSTGGALTQTDGLNALLGAANYFAVSDDLISVGGGAFTSWGPLRLGVEHVRMDAGEESTPAGRHARLEARYTVATVGWDFRPRGRLSLAPALGVGRGLVTLGVGDRAGGAAAPTAPAPTFAEVLATPGRTSALRGSHWVFEPMLAAELLVLRRADARRGITVGVRGGYRLAPNRADWTYRGVAVTGTPLDQASGPVLRLTIGVGGR